MLHSYSCAKFQNIISYCCLFPWSQGLRKFWLLLFLKSAKKTTFFKPATAGEGILWFFKKLKMKRNTKKIWCSVQKIKNSFAHLGKLKKILNFQFIIFFLAIVLWCLRKVFANFSKMLLIRVPVICCKWIICRACDVCGRNCRYWEFNT